MQRLKDCLRTAIAVSAFSLCAVAQGAEDSEEASQCLACHGNSDVWDEDTQHLFVTASDLAADVHGQKGIGCFDCHGGNPNTFNLREAHAIEDGFRVIETPADVPGFCGHCHSDMDTMQRYEPSITVDPVAEFWEGVHGQHLKQSPDAEKPEAATCLSCHPRHDMRAAEDPQSSVHPRQLIKTCGDCHTEQRTAMRKGVHHASGERNELGAGTPLDCLQCHGTNVHGMVPAKDSRSPVFLDHQVTTCGACHENHLDTYNASVHGHGLHHSGLLVTAVCSDCHGAHDMYYAADRRSTLHPTNIAHTCGQCHQFIEDRLNQSVHGRESGLGEQTESPAVGGRMQRKPSCVDCHQGHDQPQPQSDGFRQQLPNRCGNCHTALALGYGMSVHGQLTRLGYEPAAKCSDCHGAHDILPIDAPQSRLAPGNRLETCKQCHPFAVQNFAGFDPHANHKDLQRYSLLHHICVWTENVLYLFFALFAVHAVLWYARSLLHTLRFGRHKTLLTKRRALVRFTPLMRVGYGLIVVSFMGLTLTGLPLKYSGQSWALRLSRILGGFESTSVWHHFFAMVILCTFGACVVSAVHTVIKHRRQKIGWKRVLLGPDSLVPNRRDAQDMKGMARWFVGLGPKPGFERWTYWEKFDYWAMYLAMALIGLSGLILWLPNVFSLIFPGYTLNVAFVIHSETALLTAGFLFIIHFFNTHLRPEKFPMDLSVLTGIVSEEHLRKARPEYLERMQREGRLEQLTAVAPSRRRLRPVAVGGGLLLLLGFILLVWILLAALGK